MLNNIISEDKLFFIGKILRKVIIYLNNRQFIEKLPEEFFNTLAGQSQICKINLKTEDLEALQIFILFTRLIGGLELSIYKSAENYFFININGEYEKYSQGMREPENYDIFYKLFTEKQIGNFQPSENIPLKEKLIKFIEQNSEIRHICNIKNLVILTHNRPDDLKMALSEYINNIKEFGHQDIQIYISDDSEKQYSLQNIEIINAFKTEYPYIIHLTRDDMAAYILEF
jgi:hypothetical protein